MVDVKKVKQLVIDSGAFLKNVPVWDYGEKFYSVPEVCQEIKDKQAQEFILKFPYEITWTQPKSSTIKFINDFTKKTGEFNSLSLSSVKILALTYDLEVEAKGGEGHLRKEPLQRKTENKSQSSAQVGSTSTEVNVRLPVSQQPQNTRSEVIYLDDIGILNTLLSTQEFINGNDIDSGDCNIFLRLISRYTSLKAVQRLFYKFNAKKQNQEMNFFERFCLNYYKVFFNITNRQKGCAHLKSCSKLPSCNPANCSHPKNCYTFDLCMHSSQCAHHKEVCETLPSSESAPNDNLLYSKYNKYCDFLADVPFEFSAMRVAEKFSKFCKEKVYFKRWFFKVLRHLKHKGYEPDKNPYPEDRKLLRETLQQLRAFDEDLKNIESSTKVFEIHDTSKITEVGEGIASLNINRSSENEESDHESDSDDGEGWFASSDTKSLVSKDSSIFDDDYKDVHVACISSDFAVQNTLLHIGLKAIGVDGKLIKSLRMYILKCFVCRIMCSDPEKLFCYKCGYKSLRRVSYTIKPDGTKYIWESRKPINTRGSKYSLPAPMGGKHDRNPMLCADQRVPQMKASKFSLQRNDPVQTRAALREINHCKSFHLGTYYWDKINPKDPEEM